MKVGDYVRYINIITKAVKIDKIKKIFPPDVFIDKEYYEFNKGGTFKEYIIKPSPNIIDLIEVGDYVNGLQVYETGTFGHNGKTFCRLYGNVAPFYEEDIKSIVTKEQFEAMEYKVGE